MDIEDSTVQFLKDLLRGSSVLEWHKMYVGGKAVHYDHHRGLAIGFVKGAGEVFGKGWVRFDRVREGKGSSQGRVVG